jgi:REP element-mobilizing transposase RayT
MAFAYTIKDQHGLYFITCTVHQWVDVFTRRQYVEILLDSLRFCQKEKGLQIYAWVIMSNHIHLIIKSEKEYLSSSCGVSYGIRKSLLELAVYY